MLTVCRLGVASGGEFVLFVLLWVLAKYVDVVDSGMAHWLCADTNGCFGRLG
jgi:hypothetical protein